MKGVMGLKPQIRDVARRITEARTEHLVFAGCGSAFFNSILGDFLFRRWTGLTTESAESLEFSNYWVPPPRKSAVILQSATGGSIETLNAARRASDEGLLIVALTNTLSSALERMSDATIAFPTGQRCGPDVSVITTRIMVMYRLALELGHRVGFLSSSRFAELEQAIAAVPEAAESFLKLQEEHVVEIAADICGQKGLLIVGGGPNWFSAREGALKVEEESSMLCKAYRPAEYPHDAIALLSPEVTTVVIAPPSKSYDRLRDCLRTGKAAGACGVALVSEGDQGIAKHATHIVPVPKDIDEMLFPPLATIFFQLLGYYLGVKRGYNPDTLRTESLDHARAWLTSFPLGAH